MSEHIYFSFKDCGNATGLVLVKLIFYVLAYNKICSCIKSERQSK